MEVSRAPLEVSIPALIEADPLGLLALPQGRGTVHLKDEPPVSGYLRLTQSWVVCAAGPPSTPASGWSGTDKFVFPREQVIRVDFDFETAEPGP